MSARVSGDGRRDARGDSTRVLFGRVGGHPARRGERRARDQGSRKGPGGRLERVDFSRLSSGFSAGTRRGGGGATPAQVLGAAPKGPEEASRRICKRTEARRERCAADRRMEFDRNNGASLSRATSRSFRVHSEAPLDPLAAQMSRVRSSRGSRRCERGCSVEDALTIRARLSRKKWLRTTSLCRDLVRLCCALDRHQPIRAFVRLWRAPCELCRAAGLHTPRRPRPRGEPFTSPARRGS